MAEMVGGLLAGSQALKPDALDFVGDGLIACPGVLATVSFMRPTPLSAMHFGTLQEEVLLHRTPDTKCLMGGNVREIVRGWRKRCA